jgi:hypothetical protein
MEYQRQIVRKNEITVRRSIRLKAKEQIYYNYNRSYIRKKPYVQPYIPKIHKIETSKLYYCEKCRSLGIIKKCSKCNEKIFDEQDFDDDTVQDDESFNTEDYRIDSSSVSPTPDEKIIANQGI